MVTRPSGADAEKDVNVSVALERENANGEEN